MSDIGNKQYVIGPEEIADLRRLQLRAVEKRIIADELSRDDSGYADYRLSCDIAEEAEYARDRAARRVLPDLLNAIESARTREDCSRFLAATRGDEIDELRARLDEALDEIKNLRALVQRGDKIEAAARIVDAALEELRQRRDELVENMHSCNLEKE